ncbi:MAG TPA: hypothetical protein VMU95_35010 [Trebonia sp.]|nr:hypothetical protein [Trebonia sp.]
MEDEHRSAGGPTAVAHGRVRQAQPMTQRRTYRSPFAVIVWWVWAVFALANLVDLAVQGRDKFSLLAAIGLVLVTGLLYAGAWRPRIAPDDDGLTISNPLRDHRIGWAAVSLVEATELIRVRCEWPVDGAEPGKRVIYAWAVHSSRRKERIRELRREVRGSRAGGYTPAPASSSVAIDADQVAAELSELAQRAHGPASGAAVAVAPVSRWHWPSIAAIVVPGLALLIAALL